MAEFNAMDTAAFKGVWVFCEQREGQIQTISYQLLSEGRKLANDLGVELCGVVMGSELKKITSRRWAATVPTAFTTWTAPAEGLHHPTAMPRRCATSSWRRSPRSC